MLARFPNWNLHARASGLSLVILALALALLWLGNLAKQHAPERLTLRTVALALPPPPPPPPQVQQVDTAAPITLTVAGAGAALPKITLTPQPLPLQKPPLEVHVAEQPQWQNLEVNWQAFSLDELDSLPSLLTPLKIKLPKSLTRKGVHQVLVKLEIVVDEKGVVELVSIVSNPHPELLPQIEQMVKSSRFSAPQMDGRTVRARFIWPINIQD